ncbi:MAG: hypothetical protein HUJ99_01675, partial [Bacteroidaceae bacterium]|nr:hypothetical protein [Bacteroidaceae bacterium]
MEYCGNTLCISATELVDGGIMSYSNYKTLAHRGKLVVVRRGGGSSQTALISVDSLPARFRNKVDGAFPAGDKMRLKEWILSNYEEDHSASVFFHSREQAGVELSAEKIREYVVNASVMNCCIRLYENARDCRKLFGEKYSWDLMTDVIEALRDEFGHTLPGSTLRFRKKVNGYRKEGYSSLISGKFGNQNTRKVDQRIERLVVSLAILPEKPYGADVHDMYLSFLCGELDVWDYETGEVMNPDEFTDRNGEPKELSESTIRNILNNPGNRVRIEKSRLGWTSFYHEQMPHMHRHSGEFSLSQITMDDVDLPRRMSGNRYVHAYYAYDVVSQCRVGVAYGMDKNDALVVECFRDMFRLIERNGWGIPAGIEVEQHLMSRYKEGFLRAGEVFRFVHFCAPQNSQEKYAEALNGAFKTTIAHKNHEGIGRWYGKGAR